MGALGYLVLPHNRMPFSRTRLHLENLTFAAWNSKDNSPRSISSTHLSDVQLSLFRFASAVIAFRCEITSVWVRAREPPSHLRSSIDIDSSAILQRTDGVQRSKVDGIISSSSSSEKGYWGTLAFTKFFEYIFWCIMLACESTCNFTLINVF